MCDYLIYGSQSYLKDYDERAEEYLRNALKTCATCMGAGKVQEDKFSLEEECPECLGEGTVLND